MNIRVKQHRGSFRGLAKSHRMCVIILLLGFGLKIGNGFVFSESPSVRISSHVLWSSKESNKVDFSKLKETIDIIDVVESYGLQRFERKGEGRATAICPFHDDRNPSLSIDSNRGIYKCFSCGAGGDAFKFVAEYSKLHGEEINYFQAAVRLNQQFGDGMLQISGGVKSDSPTLRRRKERMYSANAAAAAFYTDALTKPFAGGARSHLRDRGLSSPAICAFGIGYAPDAYFGESRGAWGQGSLTQYLRELNFTAEEVVAAGLAKVTKRSNRIKKRKSVQDGNITEANVSFETVIDLFRGRLVVPIFDRTGKNVLGFGGRILESTPNTSAEYQAPKYVNSPESLVFSKKDTLFGYELARRDLKHGGHEMNGNVVTTILVEGYMDAIALWDVGVKGVTASMGTAVSFDQISLAAQLVGNGRLVLCLDNDIAGLQAVERLCSNGILGKLVAKYPVDLRIASLANGVKDPAEFVEARRGLTRKEIAMDFQSSVIEIAETWEKWYVFRLMKTYEQGVRGRQSGSFSDVFGRIAAFLGTIENPGDRTRLAYEAALDLAQVIAKESGTSIPSDAVQTQLESDLIDLATRNAHTRAAVDQRVDSTLTAASFSKGLDGERKEVEGGTKKAREVKTTKMGPHSGGDTSLPVRTKRKRTSRPSHKRRPRSATKSLTPHFAGFNFKHKSDAEWLDLQSNTKMNVRTTKSPRGNTKGPVYFNSNDYHGQRFLTDEAQRAGYEAGGFRLDPSFVEKGVGSLLRSRDETMARSVEEGLLQTLVTCPSSRVIVKNMLDSRHAINAEVSLCWSSVEREWLFSQLVEKSGIIPGNAQSGEGLRAFLSSQPDCPDNCFSAEKENGAVLAGGLALDSMFPDVQDDDHSNSAASVDRSNTHVQELWSSFLLTSALYRVRELQDDLKHLSEAYAPGQQEEENELTRSKHILEVGAKLREQIRSLQSLSDSSTRLSSRLMDNVLSERSEGRLSPSLQQELAERLDEHMEEIKGMPPNQTDGYEHMDHESEADALERIAIEWGDWADDDYSWNPEHGIENNVNIFPPGFDMDDPEAEEGDIEEELRRIAEEWKEWDADE